MTPAQPPSRGENARWVDCATVRDMMVAGPEGKVARFCPECGSDNYTFRSRKQIQATAEKGPELETKYLCRECENEWKERMPGVLKKAPPRE